MFIENEIVSGRYAYSSEFVHEALPIMEECKGKLEALRFHLARGDEQTRAGEFIDNLPMDALINDLDSGA